MKVKTRFGVLTALACSALLLASCQIGGGNQPQPKPSFHVVCSSDDAKYTVNGLADTYKVGVTVSFTITENDSENWKVTGVTSSQVTVTTVSALSYSFTMPENDVTLTVQTREVDRYSVVPSSSDIKTGDQVTFLLNLGAGEVLDMSIEKAEGETKNCTITGNKVTFNESGTFHLKFNDNERTKVAIADYEVVVRAPVHGETEDDPLTVEEALTIGHTLAITWTSKDGDTTVWHYGDHTDIKYYIKGIVTEVKEYSAQNKNITCYLGDLQVYRTRYKNNEEYAILATVEVGTEIVVYTRLMNFGGQNTAMANGTVETYSDATTSDYPSIRSVNNTVLQSIVLSQTEARLVVGQADLQLTATLQPNTGATVTWTSSDLDVATVTSAGAVHAVANGQADITASAGGKTATCHVIVSATEQVFRALAPSEVQEDTDYYLCANDGQLAYAKDAVAATYYVGTTRTESEASIVRVIKSDTKFIIKLGNSYLGYQYSESHHNILRESSSTSDKIVKFEYDSASFRLHFSGGDSDATELYLNFYSNNMSYTKTSNSNPEFSIYGWADVVAVTDVALSASSKTVTVGNSFTLTYAISPRNGTVKTAVFASSATAKATVTQAGVVTGVEAGSANITLTVNGTIVKTCAVTVEAAPTGLVTKEVTLIGKNFTIDGKVATYTSDGITFTVDQSTSTSGIDGAMNSTDLLKVYKYYTLKAAVSGTITKIEYTYTTWTNGTTYTTSIFEISDASVTLNETDKVVTISLNTPAAELQFKAGAQVRLKKAVVSYVAA